MFTNIINDTTNRIQNTNPTATIAIGFSVFLSLSKPFWLRTPRKPHRTALIVLNIIIQTCVRIPRVQQCSLCHHWAFRPTTTKYRQGRYGE